MDAIVAKSKIICKDTSNIGRVFTPKKWAIWVLSEFKVYEQWKKGASIIDPTCGQGIFLRSLIEMSIDNGEVPTKEELSRLTGVEIFADDKQDFLSRVQQDYGIRFPKQNFHTEDFVYFKSKRKFDIAVGNPPWVNFTDLETDYKESLKDEYVLHGLVKNRKEVLLGSSRADFASLIIQKCMRKNVKSNGSGYFFVPLSLFFNDSANKYFRPVQGENNVFAVKKLYDFQSSHVFSDVITRNGFVVLKRGVDQDFPVVLRKEGKQGKSKTLYCRPLHKGGAWGQTEIDCDQKIKEITVQPFQSPRQGINTCGLNAAFIFQRSNDDETPLAPMETVVNGFGMQTVLPSQYLLPLLGNHDFGGNKNGKSKYILCLYEQSGTPLKETVIRNIDGLWDYLSLYRPQMESRKGLIIQSYLRRGIFWALLGVGPYAFAKYKVVWVAQGRKKFKAIVVDGRFQGNQAIHAYIPCHSELDAERIKNDLNEIIPDYLSSFSMEGTRNWAQPGRIKHLMSFSG